MDFEVDRARVPDRRCSDEILEGAKRVLLLEPGYRNKYPPLGLMKLAAYHRQRGDAVTFAKGLTERGILLDAWDRVYVTTLFSFEWKRTAETIDFAIQAAGYQPERVFVGGIAASLMHEEFLKEPRWAGVRFIRGLLEGPPARALQLRAEDFEFGADDLHGTPIEETVPDYSILEDIDYTYPVRDAYFGYASRGCVRKCSFCGVPKLEGAQRDMPPLASLVNGVDAKHGPKKDLVLMDNNITASARYKEVIAEIRDLGFEEGAKLRRNDQRPVKRRVDFNQGVDARILVKSPMYLREMATICISPLRIAFDHIGLRKIYTTAVRMAADNGITSLSNYMLYNFMDSPEDLYERMRLNIGLNEELGVRIWSFPMRYQPVTLKDRSHVGRRWNRYYLRSFQIMLQATRGVVSGNPSFFERAYGRDQEEFLRLLELPHALIFHREQYEQSGARDEYEALRARLSESQRTELIAFLAQARGEGELRALCQRAHNDRSVDATTRQLLRLHALNTKDAPGAGRDRVLPLFPSLNPDPAMPSEEEFVEDAGLFSHEEALAATRSRATKVLAAS